MELLNVHDTRSNVSSVNTFQDAWEFDDEPIKVKSIQRKDNDFEDYLDFNDIESDSEIFKPLSQEIMFQNLVV
jgi:hypothetical protein